MIFIPERHEPLRGAPWNEEAARSAIQRIVDASLDAYDSRGLWPMHPRDAEPDPPAPDAASIYFGAAGAIWGLLRLKRDGMATMPFDFKSTIAELAERGRRFNEAAGIAETSYFLGNSAVYLLQWKELRDAAAADALFLLAESNLTNPIWEALWGSPGTMIAALHMIDDLADRPDDQARWIDLLRRGAQSLFDCMHLAVHSAIPDGKAWLWTQDMYNSRQDYLGAGHGFAGNMYPILRGAPWLDATLVERFEERATHLFRLVALHDIEAEVPAVNWESIFDPASLGRPSKPLMQDCHGAPGIVCRLASTRSASLRQLLIAAGEGTWRAGPLRKPPGLCHGTDGNGYAFLRLHAMTGERHWLDRARSFAMHAIEQSAQETAVHGRMRFTLWTGDIGLAAYLSSCIRADPAFPTLDVF